MATIDLDYYECLTLYRAIMEAKFAHEPLDKVLPASPLLSRAAQKVLAALIDFEIAQGRDDARKRWAEWLRAAPDRLEWQVVLGRVRETTDWATWSPHEQAEWIRQLFSPVTIDEEAMQLFRSLIASPR